MHSGCSVEREGNAHQNDQGNQDDDNSDEYPIYCDPFPSNDEKMWNGIKYYLCRKCWHLNKKKEKKDGMWRKATTPSAHKTNNHKVKGQHVAIVQ